MCHLIKKIISLILVLSICSTLVGVNVVFAVDAEGLRYDFEDGLSGAAAGSETTASALAIDGECVLTTKNTNLSAKNIRLKLPEINFGDGGYYMYARVKYELPSGIQIASVKCMDVDTKVESGVVAGSWNGYETKKLDLTSLKGKKTLSLSFTTAKVDVSGIGKVYIDWIAITKSPLAPDSEANGAGGEQQYVEMFKDSKSSAVRFLVSLGIMNYDEDVNSFWDDSPVKRVQIAELLCKLYGLEAVVDNSPMFSDVKFEDRAVVETVVRNGYMSGCGNGMFEPDKYITGYQLITVFVTMLGGKTAAEEIGGFPDGYFKIGQRLGLKFSRMGSLNGNATRMDVANIIYDAMHSEYLLTGGISGNNIMYETRQGYTFLSEVLGIYRIEGVMSSDNATSITQPGGYGQNRIVIGDAIIEDPRKISDGYFGYDVIAYEKRNDDDMPGELIYIEESKNNEVLKLDGINNILEDVDNQEVSYYEGDRLKSIKISYAMDMIYNGVAENYSEELLEAKTNDEIQFIDNDGDGKFNLVIVYDYQDYVTNVSRPEQQEISLQYGEKTLRLDDCILKVYNKGIPSSIETIGNNQIISVAVSQNRKDDVVYTIKTGFDTVEGAVESSKEEDGNVILGINGTDYRMSDAYEKLVQKNKIKALDIGDEAVFYLNFKGEIVTYEIKTSKEKVACLIGYHISNEGISSQLTVKLYTLDKKLQTYTTDEKVRINGVKKYVEDFEQDLALMSKFSLKQIVKYTASGDVLKSLTFAKDGYNLTEFSKDVSHRWMKGTRTSVLCERDDNGDYTLERYRADKNTVVFRIPLGGSSNQLSNKNIVNDESLYSITNGTFFAANNTGKVELYDVREDGTVGYVLLTHVVSERNVSSNSKAGVISGIGEAVNKDDEVVDKLRFYDETGTEVSMCTRSDVIYWIYNPVSNIYETIDVDSIKNGDIIQYVADKSGEISQVLLRRNSETLKQVSVVSSENKASTDLLVNARVAFRTNEQFTVYTTEERPNTPLEVEGIVSNTGTAVYLFDSDVNRVYPLGFDQIEENDLVTALVDSSNKTRILVVYR